MSEYPYSPTSTHVARLADLPIISTVINAILLPIFLAWPVWFVAKFLGFPWKIVVRKDDREVRTEKVRGWKASRRRVAQIAAELEHSGGSDSAT
ncbi:hypothetical protein GO011_07955 [Mycobacterium sp. 20091114027_K0903767]|nr:hypothetical protein [Mycobacterium sp. 20091114027_K0903767]